MLRADCAVERQLFLALLRFPPVPLALAASRLKTAPSLFRPFLPAWGAVVIIITGFVRAFGKLRRIIEGDEQFFRLVPHQPGLLKLFVKLLQFLLLINDASGA